VYLAYLDSSLKYGILFWDNTRNLKKFKLKKKRN